MNTSANTLPNPTPALEVEPWADNSPTVSMDIGLAKLAKGKVFDFDMAAYNASLDKEGVGDERKNLTINFLAPSDKLTSQGYKLRGGYNPIDNEIGMEINEDNDKTNKYLQHETGHFVRQTRSENKTAEQILKSREKDTAAINRHAKLLKFAPPLGLLAISEGMDEVGKVIGPNLAGNSVRIVAGLVDLAGLGGGLMAATRRGSTYYGMYLSYYTSREERFAHKYARKHSDDNVFSAANQKV